MPYIAVAVALRLLLSGRTIANIPFTETGDVQFYYQAARLSDSGLYPFVHFWVEYPPVFPFILTGLYRLLALAGLTSLEQFSTAYAAFMSGIDLVNLVLVYRLVRRVHGDRAARLAAVIYAGCPVLVWFSAGWFDALAVLFALLALDAMLERRTVSAGVWIALGVLTKIFPGVLILAAPAAIGWRATVRLVIVCAAVCTAVLTPLLLIRTDMVLASVASMATRGPWETVPALLSGYYGWGTQAPLEDRFAAISAFSAAGATTWLTYAFQAITALGVWAGWQAWRSHYASPRDVLTVTAVGITSFALSNKGFSPQFVAWLVPGILLVWPTRTGLLYVALLTAHTFAYEQVFFPPIHAYYVDHLGSGEQVMVYAWISVALRTTLMCWITAHLCWKVLTSREAASPRRDGARCTSRVARPLGPSLTTDRWIVPTGPGGRIACRTSAARTTLVARGNSSGGQHRAIGGLVSRHTT